MAPFIFIWLGFAVVTAIAAHARNHSATLWFMIGLLGGIFALLAVLVMRPGEPSNNAPRPIGPGVIPVDGTAERYRGTIIHRNGDFFSVNGIVHRDIETARAAVDAAQDR